MSMRLTGLGGFIFKVDSAYSISKLVDDGLEVLGRN